MNVVETSGQGKRYGSTWALRECTLAVPAGYVTALLGPNGAGKTTLLTIAAGLTAPSAGTMTVLGGQPPGVGHQPVVDQGRQVRIRRLSPRQPP
jgi:ABC-2 type transport system ATP-binding protein